jgi:hypothetical protein
LQDERVMSLERLQQEIVAVLKSRRSETSFVGGSSVFNESFPRRSDDIDIYAEDVAIETIANADIAALRAAGYHADVDDQFYGFVIEATVARTRGADERTKLEWSEPDRQRFFPVQQSATFGWTLHKADLAVQKLIAAAARRQARDAFDLLLISRRYAPLAALALAAPAKLENVSPVALLERALRNAIGHPIEDYLALKRDNDPDAPAPEDIKRAFADAVDNAIETIARDCAAAAPGALYLAHGSEVPALPRDADLLRLQRHEISARGTVPIFSTSGL